MWSYLLLYDPTGIEEANCLSPSQQRGVLPIAGLDAIHQLRKLLTCCCMMQHDEYAFVSGCG